MSKLVLFYKNQCAYCKKVTSFMDDEGIDIEKRNINIDYEAGKELVRVGGKNQVPCLFIDGKPMYESEDIIGYLRLWKAGKK